MAQWRTGAGEEKHVSTDFIASSCLKFENGNDASKMTTMP